VTETIFKEAEHQAKTRAHWLERANDTARSPESLSEFPRRRCLRLARKAEARIVDLSIRAEVHCRLNSTTTHQP